MLWNFVNCINISNINETGTWHMIWPNCKFIFYITWRKAMLFTNCFCIQCIQWIHPCFYPLIVVKNRWFLQVVDPYRKFAVFQQIHLCLFTRSMWVFHVKVIGSKNFGLISFYVSRFFFCSERTRTIISTTHDTTWHDIKIPSKIGVFPGGDEERLRWNSNERHPRSLILI